MKKDPSPTLPRAVEGGGTAGATTRGNTDPDELALQRATAAGDWVEVARLAAKLASRPPGATVVTFDPRRRTRGRSRG